MYTQFLRLHPPHMALFRDVASLELANFIFASSHSDNTVRKCLKWLLENLPSTQVVKITQLEANKWCIVAEFKDYRRGLRHPLNERVGFVVDVLNDGILFHDQVGSCFFRGGRWEKKLINKFGSELVENNFVNYGDTK